MARKILIVDDVEINRKILGGVLKRDYDILEAADGEEALAVMHRSYKMLSAVLLDIVMPVMDGFEVLRRASRPFLSGRTTSFQSPTTTI